MNHEFQCPLIRSEIELLQVAVRERTGNAQRLSSVLHKSPGAIKTDFARICHILDAHDRVGAVVTAIGLGLVAAPHLLVS